MPPFNIGDPVWYKERSADRRRMGVIASLQPLRVRRLMSLRATEKRLMEARHTSGLSLDVLRGRPGDREKVLWTNEDVTAFQIIDRVAFKFMMSDRGAVRPHNCYYCRYELVIVGKNRMELRLERMMNQLKKKEVFETAPSSDEEDDLPLPVPVIAEGSHLRTKIAVGPAHQAKLPPFNPRQTLASRGATRLYSSDCIGDDDWNRYWNTLGQRHQAHLNQNSLSMMPPSGKCTAARMVHPPNAALRPELDMDAAMEHLATHQHKVDDALQNLDLDALTTSWSRADRLRFDAVFTGVPPSEFHGKTTRQVIDYYYRFVVPDRFRGFVQTKRKQADPLIRMALERRSKRGRTFLRATGAVDERRQRGKELLVQIEAALGSDVLAHVLRLIKECKENGTERKKRELVAAVAGDPELQQQLRVFVGLLSKGSSRC